MQQKAVKSQADRKNVKERGVKTPSPVHEHSLMELHQTVGNHGILRRRGPAIQTKLRISSPGDNYEREADRVAEQVLRAPDSGVQRRSGEEEDLIQEKPIADQITPLVQRQTEPEEEEEDEAIQTKAAAGQMRAVTPEIGDQIESLQGGGQPLPQSARAFFEPRFGYDFSQVRLHTGPRASETAKALNAQAFTRGRDVVFGGGQYVPETAKGSKLLAHELTHVVQQRTGRQSVIACQQQRPPLADDDIKLRGWMDLSGRRGGTPHLVASIYFRTKDYVPESEDNAVLHALAKAYLYTAQKKGGLRGLITGHADVRASSAPNNMTLSRYRAFWVRQSLQRHLERLTGIEGGYFDLKIRGEGTVGCERDPMCRSRAIPYALAVYRRADIYIYDARIPKPESEPQPKPTVPSGVQRTPTVHDWAIPLILKGHKKTIKALVANILGDMEGLAEAQAMNLEGLGVVHRVKPPWWDGRMETIPAALGRPELVKKALLLVRDYREFVYWDGKVHHPNGSMQRWIRDKSKENWEILAREGGYWRFIRYQLMKEARKVYTLAGD